MRTNLRLLFSLLSPLPPPFLPNPSPLSLHRAVLSPFSCVYFLRQLPSFILAQGGAELGYGEGWVHAQQQCHHQEVDQCSGKSDVITPPPPLFSLLFTSRLPLYPNLTCFFSSRTPRSSPSVTSPPPKTPRSSLRPPPPSSTCRRSRADRSTS